MTQWQDEVELHRVYVEARSHRNSFFDKLAVLDGGIVALVITAVLGPMHEKIGHRYLLGIGLSILVLAMLTLLGRNLLAVEFEFHAAAGTARDPQYLGNAAALRDTNRLNRKIHHTEQAGVVLSAIGIVLLLVEVWLVLLV